MRIQPILGMLVATVFGSIAEVHSGVVPGLLEREIPAGSPARPSRFIAGDLGEEIPYIVDLQQLPEDLSQQEALTAIENAFRAWAEATGLRFALEGTAEFGKPASDFSEPDGKIRIQCHDIYEAISGSEVLGIGGSGSVSGGIPTGGYGGMVFGEEFHRTVRGYIILNHRHAMLKSNSTFEEVVCHEIGHLLGLEHSSEVSLEPDARLREALMYVRVHADGRGATLTEYDRQTARKAYPLEDHPPGVYPATMTAVSFPEGATQPAANVNSIRVAAIDLDRPADTLELELHGSTSENFGIFTLEGDTLSYLPEADVDEARLDPSGAGFHDRAVVRVRDGPHGSAYESVRVIEVARDSAPALLPDGLPDAWMIDHFGSIVPVAGISEPSDDPDGDGCDNLGEFMQQTDPMDSSSNTRIAFDGSSPTVIGEGESLLISLVANRPLARTVELGFSLHGSAQGGGIDYLPQGWSGAGLLWPAGQRSRSLMVQIIDDGLPEIDETIELEFGGGAGVKFDGSSSHTVTIPGDTEPPIYDFASSKFVVAENNGIPTFASLSVRRSGNTGIASAVTIARTRSAGGGAPELEPLLIEFAPGEVSASVDVAIEDDAIDEAPELILLSFSSFLPFGAPGGDRPDAELHIYDDDGPPQLSAGDVSINEAAGTIEFPVSLSEISAFPVGVHYSTSPGSAAPGLDFAETTGELVIPAGGREGIISVPLVNDLLDEDDETIEIVLNGASHATIAAGRATGTILDNDPPPNLTLFNAAGGEDSGSLRFLALLSAPSGRTISFEYRTRDQSASAGEDYSAISGIVEVPSGTSTHLIGVPLRQDCEVEDTETFLLGLSAPMNVLLSDGEATGRILDVTPAPCVLVGDSAAHEGDGAISFPLSLPAPLDSALTVRYRTLSGSAELDHDLLEPQDGEITFPPGATEASIEIALRDDSLDEEDEQFTLEVLAEAGGEFRMAGRGQGRIIDDDPQPSLVLQAAQAAESAGMIPIVIRVSPPSGREIRIRYRTQDGSAIGGADYQSLSGQLAIPALTGEVAVPLTIHDDDRVERTETILFSLDSWEGAAHDGTAVQLALHDDDASAPPDLSVLDHGGIMRLTLIWQGVEGMRYELQSSLDLRSWSPLVPPLTIRATGLVESVDELPTLGDRGFYRVRELLVDE